MANSSVPASGGSGPSIDVETIATNAGTVNRPVGIIGSPTVGGQRMEVDNHSSAQVKLYDSAGNALLVNPSTGQSGTDLLAVAPMEFNGTNWDPFFNNNDTITLLASAARTSVAVGSIQNANNWTGVFISISITNIVSSCSLQVILASGGTNYVFAQSPTPLTATGAYGYLYYPGASGTNVIAAAPNNIQAVYSIPLAGSWTAEVLHGNANAITYSVVAIPII